MSGARKSPKRWAQRLERDCAGVVAERLYGVLHQIDEDLFELLGVAVDLGQLGRQLFPDRATWWGTSV